MKVEIWSDVVCPWCYIGKRRFETALARFPGAADVEVTYHAYQLDPTAPPGSTRPVSEVYARKFGGPEQASQIIDNVTATAAADGITFHLDQALRANTLLAHRVIWFAGQAGQAGQTGHDGRPGLQAAVKERLMAAYFTEGLNVGDPSVLAHLAAEAGLDRAAVEKFLAGTDGHDEVMEDIAQAAAYGITAVPTYVINGRWSIPGAQDPETFLAILTRSAERSASS